jgi:hypothetical protein
MEKEKEEQRTRGQSIYLPETDKEDAILVVRIGYRDGFNSFNYSALGTQIFQDLRKVL